MAVADALISKLVDMLVSTIQQEVKLLAGVEEEVEKVTLSLESIQAVLVDAERRKLKETTVQLWLDRLTSVAYDIDDVLDECSYEILRLKIPKPTSKVWCFHLRSACYCFPKVVSRHQIAVKISNLNGRLDFIANEKERYGFQHLGSNIERVEHYITTSDIDISEVKGRDVEKEKLVGMLLSGSTNLRLISVVGMGGVGKTTLARLVYNDEKVKSQFKGRRVWVCVSDPFDETRIAKEILESIKGARIDLDALPNIMKKIQESLVGGEGYLFVLDDVWNEDPRKWKQLEDCLKGSASKITILVTTRNGNVGRIMGCLESDIFRVGLLSEEESWELFCVFAFSRRSSQERESLEEIGREVVRRCKGLPLAVRAIAGLLRFKEHRTEWERVLDSELWDLEEVQRDIVGPLWLSYYDLPSHLKQCFSYCAVFPKDYVMEKGELIRHWMAQGFIQRTKSKDVEMTGDEYFTNLVMRCLFQDIVVDTDSLGHTEVRCKMHDLVHDFAQLVAAKECLSIEVDNDGETINFDGSVGNLLHHLYISFRERSRFSDSFQSLKKLRSLIVKKSVLDLQKIFSDFTFLRSLVLRDCGIIEVPSNINRLIHLKELDLSDNTKLTELPEALWDLYNLQILNFGYCEELKSVKGIGRLINLRCLDNYFTFFPLPKEMMRLNGLRRLNWVHIDADNEEAFSLKYLKNFNRLSGSLLIDWSKQGDGVVEDAKQAHLQDKKYITQLLLGFDSENTYQRRVLDEKLVEALNAPPNLEFLRIDNYMGLRTPNWMDSLTFLKMVHLDSWMNCEDLPNALGKLACLEKLELYTFSHVKKVGAEFLGINEMLQSSSSTIGPLFPKLTSLSFRGFPKWVEWKDVEKDEEMLIMPSLTYIEIYSCPKLKSLPNFILEKTALKMEIRESKTLRLSLDAKQIRYEDADKQTFASGAIQYKSSFVEVTMYLSMDSE